jgi:hypothetical protein
VLNAGLGGNRVLKAGLGPSMLDRFTRDVFSVPEATHVIIMGGANDIGLPGLLGGAPPTGRELGDGLHPGDAGALALATAVDLTLFG